MSDQESEAESYFKDLNQYFLSRLSVGLSITILGASVSGFWYPAIILILYVGPCSAMSFKENPPIEMSRASM